MAKIIDSLTLDSLERWNQARVSGGDGEWAVTYPDGPTFRWKVIETSRDKINWRCEEGPGNAKGSEADFNLLSVVSPDPDSPYPSGTVT